MNRRRLQVEPISLDVPLARCQPTSLSRPPSTRQEVTAPSKHVCLAGYRSASKLQTADLESNKPRRAYLHWHLRALTHGVFGMLLSPPASVQGKGRIVCGHV